MRRPGQLDAVLKKEGGTCRHTTETEIYPVYIRRRLRRGYISSLQERPQEGWIPCPGPQMELLQCSSPPVFPSSVYLLRNGRRRDGFPALGHNRYPISSSQERPQEGWIPCPAPQMELLQCADGRTLSDLAMLLFPALLALQVQRIDGCMNTHYVYIYTYTHIYI